MQWQSNRAAPRRSSGSGCGTAVGVFVAFIVVAGLFAAVGQSSSGSDAVYDTPPYDPWATAQEVWTPFPTQEEPGVLALSEPRVDAAAVTLTNGDVLVVGGGGGDVKPLSSAELYLLDRNQFMPVGSMWDPRAFPMVVALPNGQALVAGGQADQVLDSAEVYLPDTQAFQSVTSMLTPREHATATLLGDGTVLVAGGIDDKGNILASAEIFKPGAMMWRPTGSMKEARRKAAAALLQDGRVLIAGGDASGTATLEIYDPKTGTFSDPTAIVPSVSVRAVSLPQGKVALVGGSGGGGDFVQLYDSTTDKLAVAVPIQLGSDVEAAFPIEGGGILCMLANSVPVELDPSSGSVSIDYGLGGDLGGETVVQLADGRLMAFGGDADDSPSTEVRFLNPAWKPLSPSVTAP